MPNDYVTVRVPNDLRDRIDAARPSTDSREAWVRDAIERKLTLPATTPRTVPFACDAHGPPVASVLNAEADALIEGAKPELCKSCETLGPPVHKPCWKCGAQT